MIIDEKNCGEDENGSNCFMNEKNPVVDKKQENKCVLKQNQIANNKKRKNTTTNKNTAATFQQTLAKSLTATLS